MPKYHVNPMTYVGEIVLKVVDINRAKDFYTTTLGFRFLKEDDNQIILTADGRQPIIRLVVPENPINKIPRRTGLYHFAILLPDRLQLGLFLKHIIEADYPRIGGANHKVSEAIYLEDPDGNGIEIYRDIDDTTWKNNSDEIEMTTEALDYRGLIEETGNQIWKGMPEETIIGHIHLHVSDLESAKRFYCDGLGFDLITEMGNSALFISTGGYHHHIGLNIWQGKGALPLPENAAGMKYFTLVFPNKKQLESALDALDRLGYSFVKENDTAVVKDPSENVIHLNIKSS